MTQEPRLDAWGRTVVPQDSAMGAWFDQRRCEVCRRQSLQRLCAECGEELAEQEVTQ